MSATHHDTPTTFGLLAEYETADNLVHATEKAAKEGYTVMDGYSPYPVGEVADALGFPRSEIGAIMFIGGLCGATMGFLMQAYLNGVEYPINVGGKPLVSWPMFAPITWELLVLSASLSGVIGLFALCGLPQPYHPLFNVPQFARATRDRFFLCIEATDPKFDLAKTQEFLTSTQPLSIAEVPE
ncbi:MAG: DUF3341 domain-containing protein [Fimbriiglobus sp.]